MVSLASFVHHFHFRKRKYRRNLKKYPNKNPSIKRLDDSMLIIGSMAPLFALPQIIHLYSTRESSGLSWPTYMLIGLTNVMWIVYGIVHKDRQIISANVLFLLANSSILLGIFLY